MLKLTSNTIWGIRYDIKAPYKFYMIKIQQKDEEKDKRNRIEHSEIDASTYEIETKKNILIQISRGKMNFLK